MKSVCSALLVFVTVTFAMADEVVKIKSEPCGEPQNAMYSTAMLFKESLEQPEVFAMTSSQFVYGDPSACHYMWDRGNWVKMSIVNWEWNTLALLTTDQPISTHVEIDLTNITSYHDCGDPLNGGISLFGYSEKDMQTHAAPKTVRAQISNNFSDRGTYAKMVETAKGTIDKGFVGGIVCNGKIIQGLISNQYIAMKPGQSSTLEFWHRSKAAAAEGALAIRIDDVLRFFNTRPVNNISISMSDQKAGIDKIVTGELEFDADCNAPSTSSGTTIPYPIGGTDPIGIGGGSARAGCIIRVKRASKPFSNILPELKSKNNWYDQALSLVGISDHLEIWYRYSSNTAFDYLDRNLNYSLQEFFAGLAKNSSDKIMTHAFSKGATLPGVDSAKVNMRTLAHQISIDTQKLYGMNVSDETTMSLIREIYFIASAAMSENHKDISLTQIDSLLDRGSYKFSWNFIEHPFIGKNQRLYTDLKSLRAQLESL